MKTAILFSGQGAQFPGMMGDLFERYDAAKELFDRAGALLGRDLYALTMTSTQEELDRTENTQPCLLVCELAAFRVLRQLGLRYEAAMGFSLGEWAALAAVGAASEEDVIGIIERRAAAMQRAVPVGEGSMAVILGKDAAFVEELCRSVGGVTPANYNCPGNISVAGTACGIDALLERAETEGVMASRIAISIPSHCALMAPAAEELRPAIEAMAVKAPETAFLMNAAGCPVSSGTEVKENLIRQLSHPVLFQQSTEYLLGQGFDTFLEIGPGKTLSGMVKRTAKQAGKKVRILQLNSAETADAVRAMV